MSTAIAGKKLSTKRAEWDVRRPARQSKAHPDCRSTTIKSCVTKISLALSSGRDNHPPAATAEIAILIVAVPIQIDALHSSAQTSLVGSSIPDFRQIFR